METKEIETKESQVVYCMEFSSDQLDDTQKRQELEIFYVSFVMMESYKMKPRVTSQIGRS